MIQSVDPSGIRRFKNWPWLLCFSWS